MAPRLAPSGNLLANPGFEAGATSWTQTTGVITNDPGATPHSGAYYAWLDGYGTSHTDSVSQSVTIPAAASATLSFYALRISSDETTTSTAYDTLKVQVTSAGARRARWRRTPTSTRAPATWPAR